MDTITIKPIENVQPRMILDFEFNGQALHLEPREAQVFWFLMANRGQLFTCREIYDAVFTDGKKRTSPMEQLVGNVMFKLRRRVPGAIENVWGKGYRIPAA